MSAACAQCQKNHCCKCFDAKHFTFPCPQVVPTASTDNTEWQKPEAVRQWSILKYDGNLYPAVITVNSDVHSEHVKVYSMAKIGINKFSGQPGMIFFGTLCPSSHPLNQSLHVTWKLTKKSGQNYRIAKKRSVRCFEIMVNAQIHEHTQLFVHFTFFRGKEPIMCIHDMLKGEKQD